MDYIGDIFLENPFDLSFFVRELDLYHRFKENNDFIKISMHLIDPLEERIKLDIYSSNNNRSFLFPIKR